MYATIAPNGHIQIDDARIAFRNFAGVEKEYNRAGDRNFSWVIDDPDFAEELKELGWNVRIKPPREDGDEPFCHLPVKVKMSGSTRVVLVRQGMNNIELNAETVGCIDNMDIERIDMDIRPYDWVVNEGKPSEKRGRAAYLQTMYVIQSVDRFRERYENYPLDEESPFDYE